MKKVIKKEIMTIVMLVSLNIAAILSKNKIEVPEVDFLVIILDIVYSFYLGRLYEFNKIIDSIEKNKKEECNGKLEKNIK